LSLVSLSSLRKCSTLAYWAHSYVTKKIKCCEYGPRALKCFSTSKWGLSQVRKYCLKVTTLSQTLAIQLHQIASLSHWQSYRDHSIHRDPWWDYIWHDFLTEWIYMIFIVFVKILFSVHLKHILFCPSTDVKPMSMV